MAINYWVHDCVASEELAQNGKIYVYFDVKWILVIRTKPKKVKLVNI